MDRLNWIGWFGRTAVRPYTAILLLSLAIPSSAARTGNPRGHEFPHRNPESQCDSGRQAGKEHDPVVQACIG